ncbi:hypothetical protein F4821DRAFT_264968 [Hypoxylon rubiginosum]|uniref:Uncharacterized protein n=1 Tax=Hypoxylon rubiginosum TaxID=110542 RepID=A0ACC0CM30_9PEZI|nr:hypothetical protein F4821DRAFT_264968 [Hypoxylon rubiginosum]
MTRAISLMAALLSSVAAEQYGPTHIYTDSIPDIEEAAQNVLRKANIDPTMTRSVRFKPFQQYWDQLPEDSPLRGAEWTWRINVSNIAAPGAEPEDGGIRATVDPHVVSTTFDFSWPGSGNFSSAFGGMWKPLCLSDLGSLDPVYPSASWTDLPVNVTNGYTEDDTDSTSCVPALGQACVDAMLAARGGAIYAIPDGTGPGCLPGAKSWQDLPECASTFGYSASVGQPLSQSLNGLRLDNTSSANTSDPRAEWTSGSGFYGWVSGPQNGSGSQAYYTATNQLRVLMINANLNGANNSEVVGGPQLLCTRVNATKLPDVDGDGDGTVLTSEAVLESYGIGNEGSRSWALALFSSTLACIITLLL